MGTKRRNNRRPKGTAFIDPHINFVADVIIDAILIASGQSPASDEQRANDVLWLQGETCLRWSDMAGVDIRAVMNHPDSLIRLEDQKCK